MILLTEPIGSIPRPLALKIRSRVIGTALAADVLGAG